MDKIMVIAQWYLVSLPHFPWAQFWAEIWLLTNAGSVKWIYSLGCVEQDLVSPSNLVVKFSSKFFGVPQRQI